MEKKKHEVPSLQNPELLMSLSGFWKTPLDQKKTTLESDLTRLVLHKLNLGEDEIAKLNEQSVRRNRELAKEFETLAQKSSIEPVQMVRRMKMMPEAEPPRLFHWEKSDCQVIPVTGDRFRQTHRKMEGRGTPGVGDTLAWDASSLDAYDFDFMPADNGPVEFNLPLFILFPYFLTACDGPFNDKYATMGMVIEIKVFQEFMLHLPTGVIVEFGQVEGGTYRGVIFKHVTNESITDFCLFKENIVFGANFLQKDLTTKVAVAVRLVTKVKGEGSIVDVNMSKGNGFIFSEDLTVCRLTYT